MQKKKSILSNRFDIFHFHFSKFPLIVKPLCDLQHLDSGKAEAK